MFPTYLAREMGLVPLDSSLLFSLWSVLLCWAWACAVLSTTS